MLNIIKDSLFIAEVKRKMYLKGWKAKELAEATNCKISYIYAFMSGLRYNENVKKSIARVLDIEAEEK